MAEPEPQKYYKRVFTVTLLGDEPIGDHYVELPEVALNGPCSGVVHVGELEEVDGPTMARLLMEQGSDPEFLGLDEDGQPLEEDDYGYPYDAPDAGEG